MKRKSSSNTTIQQPEFLLQRVVILVAITIGVYIPALFNGLVNWDDTVYIIGNPLLKSFSINTLNVIFTQSFDGHYSPLTLLSLLIDYQLAGLSPFMYHLTSLLLHVINVVLVFKLIQLLTGNVKTAFITALLFAVHPLNVEAVAWASGRKDVLFALFFFASLISYRHYLVNGEKKYYALSLFLFILSCLAKEQAVALAVLLFVFDYFYKRKITVVRSVAEKLPYIAIALVFGLLTIWAQKETGYLKPLDGASVSIVKRLVLGSYGLVMYIVKLLVPVGQNAYYSYPFDVRNNMPWFFGLFTLILPAIVFVIIRFKRFRFLVFGLAFFIINIFLMLRFLQANPGDFVIAERYMYIPAVGLFMIIATGFSHIVERYRNAKKLVITASGLIVLCLALLSVMRITIWKDSMTLLNDIISKNPKAYTALNCRGDMLAGAKKYDEAIVDFTKAIAINPYNDRGFANRGRARAALGQYDAALNDLSKAVHLSPNDPLNYNNRGLAYFMAGANEKAIGDFNKAISLRSDLTEAYINRGNALLERNDPESAIADFTTALNYDPLSGTAYTCRAIAYNRSAQFASALTDLKRARELNADNPHVYFQTGFAHYNLRNFKTACTDFTMAISADESYAEAWLYRGFAYYNLADYQNCITDLNKACQLSPGNALAYGIRGMAYIRSGKAGEGCSDLTVAANLGNKAVLKEIERNCNDN